MKFLKKLNTIRDAENADKLNAQEDNISKINNEKEIDNMNNSSKETTVNNVYIQGDIVNKLVTDKVAIVTICTGNASYRRNYPKVVFFNEEMIAKIQEMSLGDFVSVNANIQSSYNKKKIKNQITISVFGETIENAREKNRLEEVFGVCGGKIEKEYVNEFQIAGELIDVKRSGNLISYTVFTNKNKHTSYVILNKYCSDDVRETDIIPLNSKVFAIGNVQTTKKEFNCGSNDTVVKHYENYVVSSISAA